MQMQSPYAQTPQSGYPQMLPSAGGYGRGQAPGPNVFPPQPQPYGNGYSGYQA